MPSFKYFFVFVLFLFNSSTACPDKLIETLAQHPVRKHIKTLKEINIAFVPSESQVLIAFCCFPCFICLFTNVLLFSLTHSLKCHVLYVPHRKIFNSLFVAVKSLKQDLMYEQFGILGYNKFTRLQIKDDLNFIMKYKSNQIYYLSSHSIGI